MIKSSPSLKSVNFCGGKDEDGQVSNSVDATWMHLVAFRPRQVGAVRRLVSARRRRSIFAAITRRPCGRGDASVRGGCWPTVATVGL